MLDCLANVYPVMGMSQKALQFYMQCLKRRVRLVSATSSDKSQVSLLLITYEDVIELIWGECGDGNFCEHFERCSDEIFEGYTIRRI